MEEEKKKKLFLALIAGLAVLAVIVALATAFGGKGGAPSQNGSDISEQIPDDELLVNDIYEGQTLIPKFDIPFSTYDVKKFTEQNGIVSYDSPDAKMGVDVSEHQGSVNWDAVKGAGMEFAFLRLGYRGLTQGLLNVDETFEQNFSGASGAGLDVGVYFFSQAVTTAEAEAEADFVVETLQGRSLVYPVVYDWEQPVPSDDLPAEDLRAYGMTGDEATACAKAFCKRIRDAGYIPCVYTNKSMAYGFFDLEDLKEYDLWYAEYQKAPSLYYKFRIWQYTETGRIPGIDGGVDVNICFDPY